MLRFSRFSFLAVAAVLGLATAAVASGFWLSFYSGSAAGAAQPEIAC